MGSHQCQECHEWDLDAPDFVTYEDYLCFNCCFRNEWIKPKDYPEQYKIYKELDLGCDNCGEVQGNGEQSFTKFKSKILGEKWFDNGICYDCIEGMLESLQMFQTLEKLERKEKKK